MPNDTSVARAVATAITSGPVCRIIRRIAIYVQPVASGRSHVGRGIHRRRSRNSRAPASRRMEKSWMFTAMRYHDVAFRAGDTVVAARVFRETAIAVVVCVAVQAEGPCWHPCIIRQTRYCGIPCCVRALQDEVSGRTMRSVRIRDCIRSVAI